MGPNPEFRFFFFFFLLSGGPNPDSGVLGSWLRQRLPRLVRTEILHGFGELILVMRPKITSRFAQSMVLAMQILDFPEKVVKRHENHLNAWETWPSCNAFLWEKPLESCKMQEMRPSSNVNPGKILSKSPKTEYPISSWEIRASANLGKPQILQILRKFGHHAVQPRKSQTKSQKSMKPCSWELPSRSAGNTNPGVGNDINKVQRHFSHQGTPILGFTQDHCQISMDHTTS